MKTKKRKLIVFSRHPSHAVIKNKIETSKKVSIRFGSVNVGTVKYDVELNKPEAVMNSSDKLRMKKCFDAFEVKTAKWTVANEVYFITEDNEIIMNDVTFKFPIVGKHRFGSRGRGNTIIKNKKELVEWFSTRLTTVNKYIIEQYINYSKEYRLHVSKNGCFYTCRKALKSDVDENAKWFRNDSNCVWLIEDNPDFKKPSVWEDIVHHSVLALKAVGLDLGAVDLRCQEETTAKGKERIPDFFVVEINSAPSFGDITPIKYQEEIIKLLTEEEPIQ